MEKDLEKDAMRKRVASLEKELVTLHRHLKVKEAMLDYEREVQKLFKRDIKKKRS